MWKPVGTDASTNRNAIIISGMYANATSIAIVGDMRRTRKYSPTNRLATQTTPAPFRMTHDESTVNTNGAMKLITTVTTFSGPSWFGTSLVSLITFSFRSAGPTIGSASDGHAAN